MAEILEHVKEATRRVFLRWQCSLKYSDSICALNPDLAHSEGN